MDESTRVSELRYMGGKLNMSAEAENAIRMGTTVDEFRSFINMIKMGNVRAIDTIPPLSSTRSGYVGLTMREADDFSIIRVLNSLIARGDFGDSRFEEEASDAALKALGRSRISDRHIHVPVDVLTQKRDLTAGTATAGGHTVATELLAASFIDLLRNAMMVGQMGATVLDGLRGDIAIPRQTGASSAFWLAESGEPTESQQVFDQVTMSPKTVGAYTDISRRLLLQSSIDMENFVRQDLALIMRLAIDQAAINGSGASNQPTGILNVSGIGAVAGGTNGAAPTWPNIVNLEKEIAKDNAAFGSLGYLTNSDVAGKLKVTELVSGTSGEFILDGHNRLGEFLTMNGYKTGISNQVPNDLTKGTGSNLSAIIFGNWRDLIIGYWGGLDILVDPYTGGLSGTLRIRVLRDVDISVRHPESFAAMTDAITV